MDIDGEHEIGLRERKRLETTQRIADASLRLFVEKGYAQTTLDEITAEAGISRRTFFYYFKSKDEILVSLQCAAFTAALEHIFDDVGAQSPLEAVIQRLPKLVAAFETPQTIVITDIMKSNESLRVSKQAGYVEMETALLAAMAQRWPSSDMRASLILVSTASISVLRLAIDQWYADGGKSPLAGYVSESFALLRSLAGR